MNFRAGPLVHAVLATEGARYVTVYVSFPGFQPLTAEKIVVSLLFWQILKLFNKYDIKTTENTLGCLKFAINFLDKPISRPPRMMRHSALL